MAKKFYILLINEIKLNLFSTRTLHKYSHITLADIIAGLNILDISLGEKISHFQSNTEHALIDRIYQFWDKSSFVLININPNPTAFANISIALSDITAFANISIALSDILLSVNISFIEIYLSNIDVRKQFPYHSYLSDIAVCVIYELGTDRYNLD